jgi:hypothetical protein
MLSELRRRREAGSGDFSAERKKKTRGRKQEQDK